MKRVGPGPPSMALIRLAALLVPRSQRREWRAEWTGELWPLLHSQECAAPAILAFSCGAFPDAFILRRDAICQSATRTFHRGSAARCLFVLSALTAFGLLLCLLLPGARAALLPLPYPQSGDLVLISGNGSPTRLENYLEWSLNTAPLFSQIAFYEVAPATVHVPSGNAPTLSVAVGSGNLFRMLGVPAGPSPGLKQAGPRLYFSRSAWKRFYRGNAALFGRNADLAGQTAVIAGVIPDSQWRLPGRPDAWLLEDAHGLAALPPTLSGTVIARIRDSAFPPPRGGLRSMVETRHAVIFYYACVTLESIRLQPVFFFLCSMMLACLALPAVTALSLGDYPLTRERLRRSLVARRWLFLAVKAVLLLSAVFFWSIAVAMGSRPADFDTSIGMQALIAFLPLLFGLRWMLQDQRRRCPVCLRLLTNPARVGQASCSFLGWNGIELICASGHGLLHIPELPTSWFGTQRWLCLDSSWVSLFADRSSAPAELT